MLTAPGGSAAVIVEALDRLKVCYRFAGATQAYRRAIVEQIVLQPEVIAAARTPQFGLHQRHHQTQRRTARQPRANG